MNTDNPQDMAKAYLDQWQQQWSQLAADPAWQQMAAQQWQQFAGSMMAGVSPQFTAKPAETSTPPAGTELGAQLVAECFMRLARLEARVAELEQRVK